MWKQRALLGAIALEFFLSGSPAAVQETFEWPSKRPESSEQLAKDVDGYLSSLEVKGFCGVVLLSHQGKVILHKAYGYADRESGKRLTTSSGMCIGSIVKPMTRAALVKLESAGKLKLGDKLASFFPNAPPDKADITLQQVIDHKAGFPDMFGDDYEPMGRDEIVSKIMDAKLLFKPGEKSEYSNSGYSLLGVVIEGTSGIPYERYVYDEILQPAGVTRIGYKIPGWKPEELAVGYTNGERWGTPLDHPWMEDGPSWNLRANGGMVSTVEELYKWFDAVLGGRVLSPEATQKYREMMIRPTRTGRRAIAVAGGNGVSNSLYVNIVDANLVFIIFTSISEFVGEEAFKAIRPRVEAFLQPE